MFTGIVGARGTVDVLTKRRGGWRLTLRVPSAWSRLPLGSSVAVDGACLTVCARASGRISFDLLGETMKRTRFSRLERGDRLNLERAVRAGQRIDGHFVQGHVDAAGVVRREVLRGREKSLLIAFPRRLEPFILPKGSVTVNGVSLTIGRATRGAFWVHLVAHTLGKTNLGCLERGDPVNLEADMLLKFFHRSHHLLGRKRGRLLCNRCKQVVGRLTRSRGHYKLIHSRNAVRKWHEKI